MTTAPGSPAPPGLMVGPYLVLAKLGEGGMGVVHLARHHDGRRVALKVMRPHIVGDDEARARLAREVSSLSLIRSRWVAEIVDADPWGEIPYVATRYVPGLCLHDHVREEGPVADLTWFAARLADGLAGVHGAGVLHRDIKPSNVLMEGRAPILIDFGLARVADDPRLTHTGWLLGTPGYLAPEILYGDDATTASDVHSWAATVAFAGTGRPPFGRGPSLAVMDRVRRGEHDLSGLDPALRPLVEAALAPEALDRPSLHELRERLGVAAPWPAPPRGAVPPPATPEVTMPMVARLPEPAAPAEPVEMPVEPPVETPVETAVETRPPWWEQSAATAWVPEEPAPASTAERSRRLTLVGLLLALAAAAVTRAPYAALLGLVVLTWLLRAGSMAASGTEVRRDRRGRRWYDAVLLPLTYPWHLVAALPGAGVLLGWSAGLGLAAVLVCFAISAPLTAALAVTGATLATGLWWGPGGSRFRGPLRRVAAAGSRRLIVWGPVALALLFAVATAVLTVHNQGVDWSPASGGPFDRGSWLRGLIGH